MAGSLSTEPTCRYVSCWEVLSPPLAAAVHIGGDGVLCHIRSASLDAAGGPARAVMLSLAVAPDHAVELSLPSPPTPTVLSADSLHNSLKICHYILDSKDMLPPFLPPVDVAQALMMPRLVRPMPTAEGSFGDKLCQSDTILQELVALSAVMAAQWAAAPDPYEKVVTWLQSLSEGKVTHVEVRGGIRGNVDRNSLALNQNRILSHENVSGAWLENDSGDLNTPLSALDDNADDAY